MKARPGPTTARTNPSLCLLLPSRKASDPHHQTLAARRTRGEERSIHGDAAADQRDPGDEGARRAGLHQAAPQLGERQEEHRPGHRPLHREVHRHQLAGAALPRLLRHHGDLLPRQPAQGAPPPRPPRGAREARRRCRPPLDPGYVSRTWSLSVVSSFI
uniref:Uncharacterized protein n=1 Tax=Oryza brachyantha TaxID=4533 RepID=J3LA32_ORYBR